MVILDYGFILGISDNNCGNFDVGHKKRFLQLHYPIPGPAEPGGQEGHLLLNLEFSRPFNHGGGLDRFCQHIKVCVF